MRIEPKIIEQVKSVLKQFGTKYLTKSGNLKRGNVINALDQYDRKIMTALLANTLIHDNYTEKIADTEVFKLNQFIEMFEYKDFWEDSFTKYTSKIGLATDNKFISDSSDVVLDFPYKDTVLKAGMDKEDADPDVGADEPFLNETLAHAEISELFEPKVLVNAKQYDKDGEHEANNFGDQDNLIIKGNNLIALHSIAKKYAGKVKLIYLDPPYNTGNGDFPYNDEFNHSTWLTFMQNRLNILYKLLSPNSGIICIQCDDNEQAYLKILMDNIFGRDHFLSTIAVQMSQPTGFKMKHENIRLPKIKEFILVYKMNPKSNINVIKKPKDKWDSEYKNILLGVSKAEMNYIKSVRDNKDRSKADVEEIAHILKKSKYSSLSSFAKSCNITINNDFLYKNAWRIFRTVSMPSQRNKELAIQSRDTLNQAVIPITTPRGEIYIIKSDFDESVDQPRIKMIFASDYLMENVCDLWTDIKTTGLDNEGVVKLSNGKKPEMLMERIIKMFSNKGDLVLDAFAGTGTTAAVAHKLHRKFVILEQLDKHVRLALQRLTEVVQGDQSGISQNIDWQGGGSFVYAELMEKNQGYLKDIQKATTLDELNAVFQRMKDGADFDFRVDLSKFENDPDRKNLSFEDQKKLLIKLLDKNQLYYNEANIDDVDVRDLISDSDYKFNKSFYGKESE